jgi:nickel superoxide dismutase
MELSRLLARAERVRPAAPAHAHCDIPCGIYVTEPAETAAVTVIKMLELLNDGQPSAHDVARFTAVKEDYAERIKREVLVLWTDYFKPEHLERFPDLHTKVWQTCKLAGAAKKTTDPAAGAAVAIAVKEVTDIFRATKAG